MRAKKYLKQQAKQDREKLLEEDKDFLRVLEQQVAEEPPKNRLRFPRWLFALAGSIVAAVLIVCFAVFFPFKKKVTYFDGNLDQTSSSFDELNLNIQNFQFHFNESLYSLTVRKTFDKISGDTLFYTANLTAFDNTVVLEIVTVCNPNYQYKNFSYNNDTQNQALANYTVTYSFITTTDEEFGFETLHATASIQKGKEMVYVTKYSELLLTPDGTFLETLQSIVI